MKRRFSELQRIERNDVITEDNHYEFLYNLQSALLLALCEQGKLGTMQSRHAVEKLTQQRRTRARLIQEKGRSDD